MDSLACVHVEFPVDFGAPLTAIQGFPQGGLATANTDGFVRVWDLVEGRAVLRTRLPTLTLGSQGGGPRNNDVVPALAVGPSGELVAGSSGDAPNCVRIWSDDTTPLTCYGHIRWVLAVAVSPSGGFVVSGSADATVRVWDASSGAPVVFFSIHTGNVLAVCVLDNGDVVSGSHDKTFRVWKRDTWACTARHDCPGPVRCLVRRPGGFAVGGGGEAGFVSLWRGGAQVWSLATPRPCTQVVFVNDVLVVCSSTSVQIMYGQECVGQWECTFPRCAALPGGRLAVAQLDGSTGGNVFRVVRPPRITTLRVMVKAWELHGGAPPVAAGVATRQATLARLLSLRRFCRPRGETVAGKAWEVVEPFARDIVGFM